MLSRRTFIANGLTAGLAAGLPLPAQTTAPRPTQQPTPGSTAPPARPTYDSVTGANSLRAHAEARNLLIGTCVDMALLRSDPLYPKIITDQYNLVVPENCMKWQPLRPTPDSYNFVDADALVAFAEAHKLKIRGHNFVWHEQLPIWFASSVTKENAEKFLTDHIHTVGRRYAGKIHSWDVINEAQDSRSTQPELLRANSPWFQLLGPGYIEIAFKAARAADPKALLTLNDYGVEYESDSYKRNAMLALVTRLKAANVPIDAVGIQSHLSAGTPNRIGPGIRTFVEQVRGLGLQVFLTEMDANDDAIPNDDPDARDAVVAAAYRTYVTAVAAEPAVSVLTTWGLTDKDTWLNQSRPHLARHPNRGVRALPFDGDYKPTPAFFALRDGLDARKAG